MLAPAGQVQRPIQHEPCRIDLNGHLRNACLHQLVAGDDLAVLFPGFRVLDGVIERRPGDAHGQQPHQRS